jgi:hypothetical protein
MGEDVWGKTSALLVFKLKGRLLLFSSPIFSLAQGCFWIRSSDIKAYVRTLTNLKLRVDIAVYATSPKLLPYFQSHAY